MDLVNSELWITYGTPVVRLICAAICGAIIGFERQKHKKAAGLRTHMLISIGACLFSLIGIQMHGEIPGTDMLRLLQGLLIGTGFICGGVIFREGPSIQGLTTAAGLWVMGAVGMASGVGEYYLAGMSTVLIFLILTVIHKYAERSKK